MKQAKMMFVIFVAFTACWLPYVLVLISDRYNTFPVWAHLFGSLTAHLHASINFIIYGVSNRKIRAGYDRFFYKYIMCCIDRKVADSDEGVTQMQSVSGPGGKAYYRRSCCSCFGRTQKVGDIETISTLDNTPTGRRAPEGKSDAPSGEKTVD